MRRPDRLVREHLRDRYLVTTDSGETFDGLLLDIDEAHLVLADAEQVAVNGSRVKVDGHLWLPRPTIRYMQRPQP